jgi:hypothetical protein
MLFIVLLSVCAVTLRGCVKRWPLSRASYVPRVRLAVVAVVELTLLRALTVLLSVLVCVPDSEGGRRLVLHQERSTTCFEGEHLPAAVLAILVLCAYVFYAVWLLRFTRAGLTDTADPFGLRETSKQKLEKKEKQQVLMNTLGMTLPRPSDQLADQETLILFFCRHLRVSRYLFRVMPLLVRAGLAVQIVVSETQFVATVAMSLLFAAQILLIVLALPFDTKAYYAQRIAMSGSVFASQLVFLVAFQGSSEESDSSTAFMVLVVGCVFTLILALVLYRFTRHLLVKAIRMWKLNRQLRRAKASFASDVAFQAHKEQQVAQLEAELDGGDFFKQVALQAEVEATEAYAVHVDAQAPVSDRSEHEEKGEHKHADEPCLLEVQVETKAEPVVLPVDVPGQLSSSSSGSSSRASTPATAHTVCVHTDQKASSSSETKQVRGATAVQESDSKSSSDSVITYPSHDDAQYWYELYESMLDADKLMRQDSDTRARKHRAKDSESRPMPQIVDKKRHSSMLHTLDNRRLIRGMARDMQEVAVQKHPVSSSDDDDDAAMQARRRDQESTTGPQHRDTMFIVAAVQDYIREDGGGLDDLLAEL